MSSMIGAKRHLSGRGKPSRMSPAGLNQEKYPKLSEPNSAEGVHPQHASPVLAVFEKSAIFQKILSHFDPAELLTIELVSKQWRQAVSMAFERVESLDISEFVIDSLQNPTIPKKTVHLHRFLQEEDDGESPTLVERYKKFLFWIAARFTGLKSLAGLGTMPGIDWDILMYLFEQFGGVLGAFGGLKELRSLEIADFIFPEDDFYRFLMTEIGPNLRKLSLRKAFFNRGRILNDSDYYDKVLGMCLSKMGNLESLEVADPSAEKYENLSGKFLFGLPESVKLRSLSFGSRRGDWKTVAEYLAESGDQIEELVLENRPPDPIPEWARWEMEQLPPIEEEAKPEVKFLLETLPNLTKSLKKLALIGDWVGGGLNLAENLGKLANLEEFTIDPRYMDQVYQEDHLEQFTIDPRYAEQVYFTAKAVNVVWQNCRNLRKIGKIHTFAPEFEKIGALAGNLHNLQEVSISTIGVPHSDPYETINEILLILARAPGLRRLKIDLSSEIDRETSVRVNFSILNSFPALESLEVDAENPLLPKLAENVPESVQHLCVNCNIPALLKILENSGPQLRGLRIFYTNLKQLNKNFTSLIQLCPNLEVLELKGPAFCEKLKKSTIVKLGGLTTLCPKFKTLLVRPETKAALIQGGLWKAGLELKSIELPNYQYPYF